MARKESVRIEQFIALQSRLERTERALSIAIGLAAGMAGVLATETRSKGQVVTGLMDQMDDSDDPVAIEVLSTILGRITRDTTME